MNIVFLNSEGAIEEVIIKYEHGKDDFDSVIQAIDSFLRDRGLLKLGEEICITEDIEDVHSP